MPSSILSLCLKAFKIPYEHLCHHLTKKVDLQFGNTIIIDGLLDVRPWFKPQSKYMQQNEI